MDSARKNILTCLKIVAVYLAITSAVLPADGKVTVEVQPASIELREKLNVPILVVVRNGTNHELGDVRLSWFTDASVSIAPTQALVAKQSAGDETAWQLLLSRIEDEPVSGKVHFRVDYILRGLEGAPDSSRLALVSTAISSAALVSMADVATVEVKTALVSLTEQNPGQLYLIVTNKLAVPITVRPFTPTGPEFVEIDQGKETVIEQQQQRALAFNVRAKDRVRPGKHLVLFEVPLTWKHSEKDYRGIVAVSREVDVGVLGESAILKLLGLPSFLLLPGFLFITTFGLLWRVKLFRADGGKDFPLKPASADFWLVAISLSILSVFIYRGIVEHDYLQSYGLNDLVKIWGGAVIIGLVIYLITVIGIRMFQYVRKSLAAKRTPTTEDSPLDILQKLERQSLGYELQTAKVTIDQQEEQVFLLEASDPLKDKIWVGPMIEYDRKPGADHALIEKIQNLLKPGEEAPDSLAKVFEEGQADLKLRWKASGGLIGPRQVERAQLKLEAVVRTIVQAA